LKETDIPHRTKMCEQVIMTWKKYYKVLKVELGAFCRTMGRISFTVDIWSDVNRSPYLAITGHWI
ncbi:hypothetical protein BD779DRAFT_1402513, partial [Infundibulicybe gibba]